jgi:hypothetical protein
MKQPNALLQESHKPRQWAPANRRNRAPRIALVPTWRRAAPLTECDHRIDAAYRRLLDAIDGLDRAVA